MRAPTPLIRFVQGRPRPSQETPVPAAAEAGLLPPSSGPEDPDESGTLLNRRRLAIGVVFVLAALGGLYFLLPKVAGLNQTWGKLKHGDPWWLALGAVF